MSQVRIAVAGAGLIGKRHIEEIDASDSAVLASIVDPGPAGPELAQRYGVPSYPSLAELFAKDKPDGIILATPNQMHVAGGLECVDAGVPVLVEKPIGDTVASATRLVEAGESARVSVLTGHHRNYSPIMAKAREIIESGVLGRLVGVSGTGAPVVLQSVQILKFVDGMASEWWGTADVFGVLLQVGARVAPPV